MDLRTTLYDWAARSRLDAAGFDRLAALTEAQETAPLPLQCLARACGIGAAALAGLALIMAVAANWPTLDRAGRFLALQAAVVLPALLAAVAPRPGLRRPAALWAWIACGGLFAFFGQTYQTGADPWQLFALWSALGLPIALAVRHDLLWAPWALVSATGISLWLWAAVGMRWSLPTTDLPAHLAAWAMACGLATGLSAPLRRWSGAGAWSARAATLHAVSLVTGSGLTALFSSTAGLAGYGLALLALAALAAWLASRAGFDLFSLSVAALGVDTLLVCGLGRLLLSGADVVGGLLLLGLAAAGVVAGTVTGLLRLGRARGAGPAGAGA